MISDRLQKKIDRTLGEHIDALTKTIEAYGTQEVVYALAEAITNLNAAVVVLLRKEQERTTIRRERQERRRT